MPEVPPVTGDILLVVPLVAFCYLPFFRKLDLTSAYEYLERRFNLAARLFASVSFILFHGLTVELALSIVAISLGLLIFVFRHRVRTWQDRLLPNLSLNAVYRWLLGTIDRAAEWQY